MSWQIEKIDFDVKKEATKMLSDYVSTSTKIARAYGKDEDVYIPGFGMVNGTESFTMAYASNIFSQIYFDGAFSQIMKTYTKFLETENQLNNSITSS